MVEVERSVARVDRGEGRQRRPRAYARPLDRTDSACQLSTDKTLAFFDFFSPSCCQVVLKHQNEVTVETSDEA